MIRIALFMMLIAGQVQALSCVRQDIALTFKTANEAEELYYVLRGALDFDADEMHSGYDETAKKLTLVAAEFSGAILTKNGFTNPLTQQITLEQICLGPWCGGAGPAEDVILFAQARGDDLVVEVSACPWSMFYNPNQAMVDRLVSCLKGRNCTPAN